MCTIVAFMRIGWDNKMDIIVVQNNKNKCGIICILKTLAVSFTSYSHWSTFPSWWFFWYIAKIIINNVIVNFTIQ